MTRRAVFLDRDGTIIDDAGYLRDPGRVRLLPGAPEALNRLRNRGYRLVVVSNQSGVGRGLLTREDLENVHRRMAQELAGHGVALDGAYYCPHAPWEGCGCRKPSPGLLIKAAEEMGLDMHRSFMVGDKLSDISAGRRAGCRAVLLSLTPGPSLDLGENCADCVAFSWQEAMQHILSFHAGEYKHG